MIAKITLIYVSFHIMAEITEHVLSCVKMIVCKASQNKVYFRVLCFLVTFFFLLWMAYFKISSLSHSKYYSWIFFHLIYTCTYYTYFCFLASNHENTFYKTKLRYSGIMDISGKFTNFYFCFIELDFARERGYRRENLEYWT